MRRSWIRALTAAVIAAGPASVAAHTLHVPGDERDLASALRVATSGDTVLVAAGEYRGPLTIRPGVRVESESGAFATHLVGGDGGAVVRARGGSPSTALVGFTLRGAAVGIDLERTVLEIRACRVSGADSVGIRCGPGADARIYSTQVLSTPAGITTAPSSRLLMLGCALRGNEVGLRLECADARIFRCEVAGNGVGIEVAAAAPASIGRTRREGNDFVGNRIAAVRNATPDTVAAPFNYWGAAACDSVAGAVAGAVRFLPFTDARHETVVTTCP